MHCADPLFQGCTRTIVSIIGYYLSDGAPGTIFAVGSDYFLDEHSNMLQQLA